MQRFLKTHSAKFNHKDLLAHLQEVSLRFSNHLLLFDPRQHLDYTLRVTVFWYSCCFTASHPKMSHSINCRLIRKSGIVHGS